MKLTKTMLTAVLLTGFAAATLNARAADKHQHGLEADAKPYPSATCLISEEKLGSMGKPYVLVAGGQEIKFCCKGCVKDYEKDKTGYMKKLAAAEAQAKAYPLKTCAVTGEELNHGKPYVFAYEGQQVKLCCKDCLGDFKKEPARFVKKIEQANKAKR